MPTSAAPTADPSTDPSADPSADPSESQGYTIEIIVAADGTITVDVEQGADDDSGSDSGDGSAAGGADGGDGSGDDESGNSPTPAKNIKDALSIALDLYRNQGQMTAVGAPSDDMQAGYNG